MSVGVLSAASNPSTSSKIIFPIYISNFLCTTSIPSHQTSEILKLFYFLYSFSCRLTKPSFLLTLIIFTFPLFIFTRFTESYFSCTSPLSFLYSLISKSFNCSSRREYRTRNEIKTRCNQEHMFSKTIVRNVRNSILKQ